jgi:hypothetical protein
MPNPGPTRLPMVVASSVVRSAYQGESHGGVYLVDLEAGSVEQVLDWSEGSISWEGRGGDRGLRGIAFHGPHVYLAASDEIFVFDERFGKIGSFRNPYLKHCHEIDVRGDRLFATSTGFDSVLEYDLSTERFVQGYTLRFARIWKARRKLRIRPRPTFSAFDPNGPLGPEPGDTCHINNVVATDDGLFASGTGLEDIWHIGEDGLSRAARIAYGSHNARLFRDGALLNHTNTDCVAFMDRGGETLRSWATPRFSLDELEHADLPEDLARQSFGRGLAVVSDDLFVAGSSPATVTAYGFDSPEPLARVTLTKDVRNAVHGLEVWPFSS